MKVWSWSNIFLHPDYYYNRGTAVRTWAMEDIRFRKELLSDPHAYKKNMAWIGVGVSLGVIGLVIIGVYIGQNRVFHSCNHGIEVCTLIGSIWMYGGGGTLAVEAFRRACIIKSVKKDQKGRILAKLLRSHDEEKQRKEQYKRLREGHSSMHSMEPHSS